MKKINIYSLLVITLLAYVFFALLQNLLPLNKIFGILLAGELLIIYFSSLKKQEIWIIFFLVIVTFFSIINMKNGLTEPNEDIIYFAITILLLSKMSDKNIVYKIKEEIDKIEKIIFIEIFILNIILLVGLFIPQCYNYNSGENVYRGFTYSGHTLASCICLMLSIYVYYLSNKKKTIKKIILCIIPLYCVLISGARTFLIPILIIFFFFYEKSLKKNKNSWLLLLIGIIVILSMFFSSSLYEKFTQTANNTNVSENKLEALTNGRLIWWGYDLKEFNKLNIFQKLFGVGYEFIYKVNQSKYGMYIWAHNDFIQLLASIGIFGVIGYIMIITRFYIMLDNEKNIYKMALIFYMIFPAIINGFYKYQHYVFSLIVLVLLLSNREVKEIKNIEKRK